MDEGEGIVLSRCRVRSFVCLSAQILSDERLAGNIHKPLLITSLDSGGQRSMSQEAVEVAKVFTSTLQGRRSPIF